MNILELDQYRLSDAIKFNDRLNPKIWDAKENMRPEVRQRLLDIAANFQEFLGVENIDLEDITVSGSNAAYTYTDHSDIDLHLVVRMPEDCDEVYRELFDAKKYQYNDIHDYRIRGADVELYVQDSANPVVSLGEYSVLKDTWIRVPQRRRAKIDHTVTQNKYQDLKSRIQSALQNDDQDKVSHLIDKIRVMRRVGLDKNGEFGPENLVFKMLRTQGWIKKLYQSRAQAQDRALSLTEKKKKKFRYGFGSHWNVAAEQPSTALVPDMTGTGELHEDDTGMDLGSMTGDTGATSSWDGVGSSTHQFLNEQDRDSIVEEFVRYVGQGLGIKQMPKLLLHHDSDWSQENHSFGRYDPNNNQLHVSMTDRHIMDILRTIAHELVHCKQNQEQLLPQHAGETGSRWENQANAMAGQIMRDFAQSRPELFEKGNLDEAAASIPKLTRNAIAAACLAVGAGGCASSVEALNNTRGLVQVIQRLERGGSAGMQEELTQELKNYVRAKGGDANAQNQSVLYRHEHQLKEGGYGDEITQGTVVRPSTVRTALSVIEKLIQQFNQYLDSQGIANIRMGHPTGSSAYYKVDPEEKIYGDLDLQIVVPDLPELANKTTSQIQDYWRKLIDRYIQSQQLDYVHSGSEPGHPIVRVAPDSWIKVDLMPHPEPLAQWGQFRVTPEHGVKGLLNGNMFSVLGDLLNLSIQHAGVQYKERNGVKQPFATTRKNYVLKTMSTNIEHFIQDIFDHVYQDVTGQDPSTARRHPDLAQNPGVDIDRPNIQRLARGIQALAQSWEMNGIFGQGDLAPYANAQDFVAKFLERYKAKSQRELENKKYDKTVTPAARDRALRDREAIAQGTQQVLKYFGESSGYIPTGAQKNDPRFLMALTQDVRPGETGRQANKLNLKTDAQGKPRLLTMPGAGAPGK
jgi:phosphoheptose isomerase